MKRTCLKVIGPDLMCFYADPVTLTPVGNSFHDHAAWCDAEAGVTLMDSGTWNLERRKREMAPDAPPKPVHTYMFALNLKKPSFGVQKEAYGLVEAGDWEEARNRVIASYVRLGNTEFSVTIQPLIADAGRQLIPLSYAFSPTGQPLPAAPTRDASVSTREAYDVVWKAMHHWRAEAARLGRIAGVVPKEMGSE